MAPKQRKPLKEKDDIVSSTTDDNTSASNANSDTKSTAKAAGSKKRQITKATQKVTDKTKHTKVSCLQKQGTEGSSNTKGKQPLKNGRSRRRHESETESSAVEKTRSKRMSKTKATSKISGHFEDLEKTPPLDGSALVKAERKIWEEIAGMQNNDNYGLTEGKNGGRGTAGKCRGNEEEMGEEMGEEVGDDETESGAKKSKSRTRKRKGKGGIENKSTSCQVTGTKQMKRAEEGTDDQKDAVYDMNDDMETDAGACVQETAKGNKYIGAHTSISGGLCNAIHGAVAIGGKAFGMFLRSQRQWLARPMKEKDVRDFKMCLKDFGFSPHMVVPHGSYLMNCASPDDELLRKSRGLLLDELQRCEMLGLVMFNFHPGSTCGKISTDEGIQRIADSINGVHEKTKYAITVLENMCCQGNTIGGRFTELRRIIDLVHNKSRIGVCIDTCHAFAAGYDLSTEEGYNRMMYDLENIIGLKYLKAVHINDSKGNVGCHLDRHENIGLGQIGLDGFRRILNDPRFDNVPFVLETPEFDYSKEVRTLYSLIKV